jgi:DNA-binding MarR family transcriptional regulator
MDDASDRLKSLLLKRVLPYECLLERAKRYPDLNPSAVEAFLHLMRTSTEIIDSFGDLLTKHEISPGRFVVLILLLRDPDKPVNPADLADGANVTRATMTGLIDTLERDGFVKREHAPDDRRMMPVGLTPEGRRFLDDMLPDYFRRITGVMSGLTEAERQTLGILLGKIEQALPEISAGPPPKTAEA